MQYRTKSTHACLRRYLENELRKRGWIQPILEYASRPRTAPVKAAYPHASRLGRLTYRPQH